MVHIDPNDKKQREMVFNALGEIVSIAKEMGDPLVKINTKIAAEIEDVMKRQEEIIEEQEERIAVMPKGGWNPVDKKLPTEYGKYWVYTKAGKIFVTEFRPDEEYKEEPFYQWGWKEPEAPEGWVSFYFDDNEYDVNKITHWMYCFEPPKEGDFE